MLTNTNDANGEKEITLAAGYIINKAPFYHGTLNKR